MVVPGKKGRETKGTEDPKKKQKHNKETKFSDESLKG